MSFLLRHVGVVTLNLEKSMNFYSRFFGFSVVNDQLEKGPFIKKILSDEQIEVRTVKMKNQDFMIEFLSFTETDTLKNKSIKSLGCTHIALTIKDIDNLYQELSLVGVNFLSKPELSEDKKAKVCFMKDPNNEFFVELVEEML
jgi:catechol 2,3-dioxygenase-like lactoylglutathione lyase family enzyme